MFYLLKLGHSRRANHPMAAAVVFSPGVGLFGAERDQWHLYSTSPVAESMAGGWWYGYCRV